MSYVESRNRLSQWGVSRKEVTYGDYVNQVARRCLGAEHSAILQYCNMAIVLLYGTLLCLGNQ